MSIRVYVNSVEKRTETTALVDCGATENFINTDHTYAMRLPLKRLPKPREVNSIRKENQSQTLLLQHAAYHQIKGFFDFPCLKVDSESLILNTY